MPIIGIMASANWSSANASSFESIATVTASGGETSITFSSIPSTYKHLQIRSLVRDTSTLGKDAVAIDIRLNGITSGYTFHDLNGNGSTVAAQGYTSQPYTFAWAGAVRSGSSNTLIYGVSIIDIIDYANTSKYKTLKMFSGGDVNGTGGMIALDSGLFSSTNAISSITILADSTAFATGSTFALYGIKG